MRRVLLLIALGFTACLVAFMAAAVVEVPGQNPPQERIAAGLAAFLYLAVCQFLVTRRHDRRPAANWTAMVALGTPLLLLTAVADARNLGQRAVLLGPWLLGGWLGIAAGAVLATHVTLSPLPLSSCRRNARACAVALGAVSVVLVAVVFPLTGMAGTFPDGAPGAMGPMALVIAGLNALLAADLAVHVARAGRGLVPSPAVLGLLACLVFLPACFLAIPVIWLAGYGPLLRAVGVVSPLCALAQFGVAALLCATAARLPETGTA